MGYIFHLINHSVWFGQGMFHSNSIEGFWACIKRVSNNLAGINFKILEDIERNGTKAEYYLDGWICFCLLIREIEQKKFNEEKDKNFLIENLFVN